jgi:hypothetical protein
VSVVEARVDNMRNLGILPPQTASVTIVPPGTTSVSGNNTSNNRTNSGTTTSSTNGVLTLQNLSHLNGSDTNTAGASGTGTIVGIVIKALAPGSSTLSIVQVNARDSRQQPIQLTTGEANVQVKP